MKHVDTKGRTWYHCFKQKETNEIYKSKALTDDYPRKNLYTKFIVAITVDGGDRDVSWYTLSNTYLDFYNYQETIPVENRHYFETILGEYPQKIYFDVDIALPTEIDPESVKNELITNIIVALQEVDIYIKPEEDIIVCTSHRSDKASYHIIVDNYCFSNRDLNKAFYQYILTKTTAAYKPFIDSLYSSLQQFRLLGSRKKNKLNIKIFNEEYNINGVRIPFRIPFDVNKELYKFERSLITNVQYCNVITGFNFNVTYVKAVNNDKFPDSQPLTELEGRYAILKVAENSDIAPENLPFKFESVTGRFVILRRIRPSHCRICDSVHDQQNPYLIVTPEYGVYYSCRRFKRDGKDRKIFMGYMEIPDEMVNPQPKIDLDLYKEVMENLEDKPNIETTDDTNNYILMSHTGERITINSTPPVSSPTTPKTKPRLKWNQDLIKKLQSGSTRNMNMDIVDKLITMDKPKIKKSKIIKDQK